MTKEEVDALSEDEFKCLGRRFIGKKFTHKKYPGRIFVINEVVCNDAFIHLSYKICFVITEHILTDGYAARIYRDPVSSVLLNTNKDFYIFENERFKKHKEILCSQLSA